MSGSGIGIVVEAGRRRNERTPNERIENVADLSMVMPCYNEEESVPVTIPRLIGAFEAAGHTLELVAVNNGSTDGTARALKALADRHPGVKVHTVEVNRGYGFGLLSGIPHCTSKWIGFIPADGQVDAADVVHLYESAAASHGDVVAKARRRFRMDGPGRKIVSITYNLFVRLLWPRLDTLDVNGTPKILPRAALEAMKLESTGWFLDPEIMIKSHYMGLRVLEFNVFARMRGSGTSHVRTETCVEFLRNLFVYRFTSKLRTWRRDLTDWRNADGAVHGVVAEAGR
jgi:polyisoprenyl-phosphate glycosyltransferase